MLSKLLLKITSLFSFGPRPGSPDDFRQNIGDTILFKFDSDDLTDEAIQTLTRQVEWLKRYSPQELLIEGHCDDRGTREYNLALGERRARKVKQYLTDHGIDHYRVQHVSYGKERPCVLGEEEAAWRINRRAVVLLR
jgi:peptidoglycan-associated lipoprotein